MKVEIVSLNARDLLVLLEGSYARGMMAASEVPLHCEPEHESERGSAAHLRTAIRKWNLGITERQP